MSQEKALTTRAEDFSAWYNDVIARAELADYSPVRGCMVIRPNGYAIWEQMQRALDGMFKDTGHQNAYFPLFIPQSFLSREAEHVEGFAPETAVVTHGGGKELEEPLVVRPTSETIIYAMYAKWIQSYRDLPLLINQWANVVRWEMRTRLFLRTTEFLWQEGHTAHATEDEAEQETLMILRLYRKFMEEWMAMPVLTGRKTDSERFAGALRTYSCEALMQDKRALQAGTSHNLGQNFARVFDVTYQTADGRLDYVWNTSWGVSTRLVGALIMTHSDDKGLVVPPKLAPIEAVVVPIFRKDNVAEVSAYAKSLGDALKAAGIKTETDLDETQSSGWKFAEWEMVGVPVRIEAGPKDMQNNQAVLVRRDTGEKLFVAKDEVPSKVKELLSLIQQNLFDKALKTRLDNTFKLETWAEFTKLMEGEGGFVEAAWCGSGQCEVEIKEATKATIRNLPFALKAKPVDKPCLKCGAPGKHWAVWAKSY